MLNTLSLSRSTNMSSSSRRRTFYSDLQQLCRNIKSSTDDQASIAVIDDVSVKVLLQPKCGYNAHATFTLQVSKINWSLF